MRTVTVTCSCGAESTGGQLGESPPGWSVVEATLGRQYREFDLCPACALLFEKMELRLPEVRKATCVIREMTEEEIRAVAESTADPTGEIAKPHPDYSVGAPIFLAQPTRPKKKLASFEEREKQILTLHHQGLSNKEISEKIGLNPNYVSMFKSKLRKMGRLEKYTPEDEKEIVQVGKNPAW